MKTAEEIAKGHGLLCDNFGIGVPCFSCKCDILINAIHRACNKARNEALEEAAEACEGHGWMRDISWWMAITKKEATAEAAIECAAAIRALKEPTPCPPSPKTIEAVARAICGKENYCIDCELDANAAINAFLAAMKKEGYVMVPITPTAKMILKAAARLPPMQNTGAIVRFAYRAAIAARPNVEG
jgi:hypothetical protein